MGIGVVMLESCATMLMENAEKLGPLVVWYQGAKFERSACGAKLTRDLFANLSRPVACPLGKCQKTGGKSWLIC